MLAAQARLGACNEGRGLGAGGVGGDTVIKTFTLAEAQMLLPVLEGLLGRAKAAAARAARLEIEMQDLNRRIFLTGGMHVNIALAARRRAEHDKSAQELKLIMEEIDAIGVKVQNLDSGLLDFPCLVNGKTVFLSWQLGEPTITHWHDEGEAPEDRKPVNTLFTKPERELPN